MWKLRQEQSMNWKSLASTVDIEPMIYSIIALHVFFYIINFGVNVRVAEQIYVFKVKSCLKVV